MILKNKYLIGSVGAVFVAILIVAVTIPLFVIEPERLVEHDPIIIWEDEDFEAYGFPGEGTQSSPYLITNYNITTAENYAIYILGTSKFFKIENCLIQGLKTNSYGLYIENIEEGTASVLNNQIVNCSIGLNLVNSNNNLILNNTFELNTNSIALEKCERNSIINNTLSKSDNEGSLLEIIDSRNTLISDNTFESIFHKGFKVLDSTKISIINNSFTNIGLTLERLNFTTVSNNMGPLTKVRLIDSSHCNITNNVLSSYAGSSISLHGSINCSVNSNLVKDSDQSIFLEMSFFCSVFDNILENSIQSIGIYESVSIHIFNNTANSIYNGVVLHKSDNCTIETSILSSGNIGIYLLDTFGSNVKSNHIFNSRMGIEVMTNSNFSIEYNKIFNTETGIRCSVNAYGNITNNLIANSTEEGLDMDHCRYFNVNENFFFGNYWGIFMLGSYFNLITNNTFEQNFNGMYLFAPLAVGHKLTLNNTIQYNLFYNNTDYAIKILNFSLNNTISFNAFLSNNLGNTQAYDDSGPNEWFNAVTLMGNFWDDWITGTYALDGSAGSIDLYPLSTNPLS